VTHAGTPPIVAVVGATATGKSALAVELAGAIGAEIVNADSMQLYRGMDIGTAKLTHDEQHGVPHHLLDIWEVTRTASVAEYQERARQIMGEIRARDRRVVLVGGSGLYVRAALDRMDFPGTDPDVRADYETRLAVDGPAALHDELRRRDPVAAAAILPSNGRRIVRALEVVEMRGSYIASLPSHEYVLPTVQVGLSLQRDRLDPIIDERVDRMWAAGFVDEVAGLMERGLRDGPTASRAIGYAQVIEWLDGNGDEAHARAETARATRRFARRQESWFSRDPRVRWLAPGANTLADALRIVTDA
jgi:tRNA dimethylallyltransferase